MRSAVANSSRSHNAPCNNATDRNAPRSIGQAHSLIPKRPGAVAPPACAFCTRSGRSTVPISSAETAIISAHSRAIAARITALQCSVSGPGCREKISQSGLVLSSDQKGATPEREETAGLRMLVPNKFHPYPRGLCLLDNQLAFENRRTNLNTNDVRHEPTLRQPTNRGDDRPESSPHVRWRAPDLEQIPERRCADLPEGCWKLDIEPRAEPRDVMVIYRPRLVAGVPPDAPFGSFAANSNDSDHAVTQ